MLLKDDQFVNTLDSNEGFLVFRNGMIDLSTLEFREGIRSSDFITATIPFDYEVPDQDGVEFVRNVIFKICNANESHSIAQLANGMRPI